MILNIYLNGYEGKLTAKNWSKLAEVSLDTATRDVKDLVAKGILSPIQGRVRDVSYTLNYVESDTRVADFTDSVLINRDGNDYISSMYKKQKTVEERISPLDKMRFEQKEMSIDDLVYKYFAYLIG
jgi:hypothetical protein